MDPAELSRSHTYRLWGYSVQRYALSYRGRDEWGRHVFKAWHGEGRPVALLTEASVRRLVFPLHDSAVHYCWPEDKPPVIDEPEVDEPFIREAG